MTPEEIIEEGWPIIVAYYEGSANRYQCNAYVRDKMWDSAVDVLFSVARHYDGRVPLKEFLRWALRRGWNYLVSTRRPLERMLRGLPCYEDGTPIDGDDDGKLAIPTATDRGPDRVDGAELMELVGRVRPIFATALKGHLEGRGWQEMADEYGTTRQVMQARKAAALRDLRQMVGEEAA